MALVAFLLTTVTAAPPQWDEFARARDSAAFVARSAPNVKSASRDFAFLKHNGVGGSGTAGWRAGTLTATDGRDLVVVWPPNMGCQDIGQFVFETDGSTLSALIPEKVPQAWRVRHHVFDVSFVPKERLALITDRVTLENISESASSLLMRLGTNYLVDWIKDGHGRPLQFKQLGGVISFQPPAGKKVGVTIHYRGVINDRGNSGIVGPNEATLTGGVWWPSTYREPTTYDITVRSPKGWTALAQGELVNVAETDTESISTYSMSLPVSFFSLSSGQFKKYSSTLGDRTFSILASPDQKEPFELQNQLNADVIRYFDRINRYPFSTWTSIVSSVYTDWALEAYSYASYPPDWLVTTEPHEISHTWWGGILPCGYLNSMWNESFATISERLYLREGSTMPRAEARLAFRTSMTAQRGYDLLSMSEASAERGDGAYSVSYDKGGSVLAMLEDELGPDKFEACLREFCASRKPGELVEWVDFERAVRKVTGTDFNWFFRQWIDGRGVMDLSVTGVKLISGRVEATLRSSKAYPRYRVECLLGYSDGTSELRVVQITRDNQTITLPVSKRVSLIKFDPYHRLLRTWDANERPRSLSSPDVRVRVNLANAFLQTPLAEQKPEIRENSRSGRLALGFDPSNPAFAEIAAFAGVTIIGNQLTWEGTTIDLTRGSFQAVIVTSDRWTVWAVGSVKLAPESTDGWLLMSDDLGRPLRAATLPSVSGKLSTRY